MKTHLVWIQSDRCRGDRGRCRPAPGRRAVPRPIGQSRRSSPPLPRPRLPRPQPFLTSPTGRKHRTRFRSRSISACGSVSSAGRCVSANGCDVSNLSANHGSIPGRPGANYYVANNQPTEAPLPPPQSAGPAPGNGQVVPGQEMTAMPADSSAAVSGYPAGGYHGASGYAAAGCGYGDVSGCMEDCGPENQWFGGVYFLIMDRDDPSPVQLAVEVPAGASYPYYPPRSITVVNSAQADYDFRAGAEVRFGSTFTVGDSCDTCKAVAAAVTPAAAVAAAVAAARRPPTRGKSPGGVSMTTPNNTFSKTTSLPASTA